MIEFTSSLLKSFIAGDAVGAFWSWQTCQIQALHGMDEHTSKGLPAFCLDERWADLTASGSVTLTLYALVLTLYSFARRSARFSASGLLHL